MDHRFSANNVDHDGATICIPQIVGNMASHLPVHSGAQQERLSHDVVDGLIEVGHNRFPDSSRDSYMT